MSLLLAWRQALVPGKDFVPDQAVSSFGRAMRGTRQARFIVRTRLRVLHIAQVPAAAQRASASLQEKEQRRS